MPEPIPSRRTPTGLTIHDLSSLRPGWHTAAIESRYTLRWLTRQSKRATQVFVVSQAVADEVHHTLGVERSRLSVLYNAPSPCTQVVPTAEEISQVRDRLQLNRPFVLCVATLEPRKNHLALIDGFLRAREALGEDVELVLVGGWGWSYEATKQRLEDPAVARVVRRLGFVDDRELACVYRLASAAAYVSLYEGFGMPALDALALGVPLVHSRDPAICEVVANCGIRVDETSVDDLADGLVRAFRQPPDISRGLARAAEFSWQKTAQSFLSTVDRLAPRG